MHIISRKKLLEFSEQHPNAADALDKWYRVAKSAEWAHLTDVRKAFNSADVVGKWTVFNISGNHFRLITEINYARRKVFIRDVLTHAEYDRDDWKRG